MNIVPWESFGDLVSLRQAMDRLFEDSFVRPAHALAPLGEELKPAIDVYQIPSEIASIKPLVPQDWGTKAGGTPPDPRQEVSYTSFSAVSINMMKRIDIFTYFKHSGQFEISRSRNCFIIRAVAPQITWPL